MAAHILPELIIARCNTNIFTVRKCDSFCLLLKDESSQSEKEQSRYIDCTAVSSCGRYFAVSYSNKELKVYNTADWSLVSKREIKRAASQITFTPKESLVIVADKSGDVYSYPLEASQEDGHLLLGHLSMLLDVLVTADEKFIITCDRDEKIRVSLFPNSYNIHSYCLGHEEFVCCISELPHCIKVLVSASGDGTLRFWDYVNGKQLIILNCSDDINKLRRLSLTDDENCVSTATEDKGTTYINYFRCVQKQDFTILCACSPSVKGFFIYHVNGTVDKLSVLLKQTVTLTAEPQDITFSEEGLLWILLPVKGNILSVYACNENTSTYDSNNEMLDDKIKSCLAVFNSKSELFLTGLSYKTNSILYKKTYDNLSEYHEKKKLRLKDSVNVEKL